MECPTNKIHWKDQRWRIFSLISVITEVPLDDEARELGFFGAPWTENV